MREGCGILFHGQISNSYLTSETRIPLFKNFFWCFGLYGIIIFISYFHASFSILLSGSLFLGSRQGSEVAGQREAPPLSKIRLHLKVGQITNNDSNNNDNEED